MIAACMRDNAEVHGVRWAAEREARKGRNIDVVLAALGFRRVGVARC